MDRRRLLQGVLLASASSALSRVALAEHGVTLAVVVAENSALKELSLSDLRRIFTNELMSDPSGTRLVPFNHPPRTPDRVAFDRLVLGMDPDSVGKFWLDRRIRGQPGPPRTVDSVGMLLKVVARLPGAIAYVRPQFMHDVRALKIDGVAPGKPGYRLVFAE